MEKPRIFGSTRLNLAFIAFFGCVSFYTLRNEVSFAIVFMVNSTAVEELSGKGNSTSVSTCEPAGHSHSPKVQGSLVWSKETQGYVLSAFFWGYIFSQVLGGYLAGRFGGKNIIGISVVVSAIITLFSPIAAIAHVGIFIALRVILGFTQGVIFPAFHSIWAVWAPPLERSLLTSICYAGNQIGNTIAMPISGLLCQYGFAGGWPSVYYVFGILGLVWGVVWFVYASDSPSTHRFIREKERVYIEDTLQETMAKKDEKKPPIPWKAIMKSPAVWGLWAGHFAGDWGAYMMAAGLPLYMNDFLGVDSEELGFLAAIPYLAYFVFINVASFIADSIRSAGWVSTINVRRGAMIIALGGQACFTVACSFCGCGKEKFVVAFITLGLGLSGVSYSGFVVNYLDIAPTFAGTMLGIGQTVACIGGILCPLLIGWLTPTGSQGEWAIVFWITFVILIGGTILFVIFARGEVQEWAKVGKGTISVVTKEEHKNSQMGSSEEVKVVSDDSPSFTFKSTVEA